MLEADCCVKHECLIVLVRGLQKYVPSAMAASALKRMPRRDTKWRCDMAEEVDVIGHLLDVEHEASGMLLDAQREADKRTADASAKADLEFKTKYKKITDALDSEENS